MELDDMKKVWNRMGENQDRKTYSMEEIASFRNARSRDFTSWIRTSLNLDMGLKILLTGALSYSAYLFRHQPAVFIVAVLTLVVLLLVIPYVYRVRKGIRALGQTGGTIQEELEKQIEFLKRMYYKVQFAQSLTNPVIVITGLLYYYYLSYGFVPPLGLNDWATVLSLVIVSFVLTIPATLSSYGFHLRSLQGCLSSLTDPEGYEQESLKFRKREKYLTIFLYSLLAAGVLILIAVMWL